MVRLLLLTEDTGGYAFETQRGLAEKMLYLIGEGAAIQQVDFAPADEPTRAGMNFTAFKSTNKRDHHKKVDLANGIATHLLRPDIDGFVLVHVDGDRRWSERGEDPRALCSNQDMFERNVVRPVRERLRQKGQPARIERLLYVLPFWSVEAWLYQATVELSKICSEHAPRHQRDAALLRRWQADPARLDEEEKPKDMAHTIQDRYNARLARALPARRVYELGLSFAATVDALKECSPLMSALRKLQHSDPL